jgi:hypothetical protein
MSVYDGVIRKTWEVHCRICEHPYLGIAGEKPHAIRELRSEGWATRQGLWVCPSCASATPPGTKFEEPRP